MAPLERILRNTDVFRPEELEVALELMQVVIDEPGQEDYMMQTLVDEEGVVRGYYCVGPTPMTEGTFDLYWIASDPEVHGKGVGTKLLEHCETIVRSRNGKLIVAETSSQPKYDATRAFYERRGYCLAARIRDYYSPGDDLVIYSKHLQEA
ncbi:MAG: GNAT family N-acetyltransferase [Bacteroidota bacterium]